MKHAAGEGPEDGPRQRQRNESNTSGVEDDGMHHEGDEAAAEAAAAETGEGVEVDIFGDNTTNAVMVVMLLLAWVAQYTVVNHCQC